MFLRYSCLLFALLGSAALHGQVLLHKHNVAFHQEAGAPISIQGGFQNHAGIVFSNDTIVVADSLINDGDALLFSTVAPPPNALQTVQNTLVFDNGPGFWGPAPYSQEITGDSAIGLHNVRVLGEGWKRLGRDVTIRDTLDLTDQRMDTRTHDLIVTSVSAGAVRNQQGYVRSDAGGWFVRGCNYAPVPPYLYPVGDTLPGSGTDYYRPLYHEPATTFAVVGTYQARFVLDNPLDRCKTDSTFCLANPTYHHLYGIRNGLKFPGDLTIFYDPATDVYADYLVRWDTSAAFGNDTLWVNEGNAVNAAITEPGLANYTAPAFLEVDTALANTVGITYAFGYLPDSAQIITPLNEGYCNNDTANIALAGTPSYPPADTWQLRELATGAVTNLGTPPVFEPLGLTPGAYEIIFRHADSAATVDGLCSDCATSDTVAVEIRQAPSVSLNPAVTDTILCQGIPITLFSEVTPAGFAWVYAWDNNGTPVGTAPELTVTAPGVYDLTVSFTHTLPSGAPLTCSDSLAADVSVTIVDTPEVDLSAFQDAWVCDDSTARLDATVLNNPVTPSSVGYRFDWFRDGGLVAAQGPTALLPNSLLADTGGVYTVEVHDTATGCTGRSVPVAVGDFPFVLPTIFPNAAPALCTGDTLRIWAEPQGPEYTYTWTLANAGQTLVGDTIVVSETETVSLGAFFAPCPNFDYSALPPFDVTVDERLSGDFTYVPDTVFANEPVLFTGLPDGPVPPGYTLNYAWYFTEQGTPDILGPEATATWVFPEELTYTVALEFQLLSTQGNLCGDTVFKEIFVESDLNLIIPNVVTPNGDGFNDVFEPITRQPYSLVVFNRWGGEVFSGNTGWRPEGNIPEGVYVYVIEVNVRNERTLQRTGTVTVLR